MKKALKGALVLTAVVIGLGVGRAHAGIEEPWTNFWAEVGKVVTYCEATKTFLSETTNDELFGSVYPATKNICEAVVPGFFCDIILANAETYTQAILPERENAFATLVLSKQIQLCTIKKFELKP